MFNGFPSGHIFTRIQEFPVSTLGREGGNGKWDNELPFSDYTQCAPVCEYTSISVPYLKVRDLVMYFV
jgi:hypothetical protein